MFADKSNLAFKANIEVISNENAKYSFYIYAYGCIINKTNCNFVFYYDISSKCQLIAGQEVNSNVLMISEQHNIYVELGPENLSKKLPICNLQ